MQLVSNDPREHHRTLDDDDMRNKKRDAEERCSIALVSIATKRSNMS